MRKQTDARRKTTSKAISRRNFCLASLTTTLFSSRIAGQDNFLKNVRNRPKKLTTPSDAVGWALTHQLSLKNPLDRPFYRYVWIPEWIIPKNPDYKWTEHHVCGAISLAINECAGQNGIIVTPEVIANGWMVCLDLRNYASGQGLSRLLEVFDFSAIDEPFFHITKENLLAIPGTLEEFKIAKKNIVPVYSPHINLEHAKLLANLNFSPLSVVRADWFIEQIYHRRYYEFMGFVHPNGTLFTKDEVFATLGIDEQQSKNLRGDQRTAIFESEVAGFKPRRVDRLQGVVGRNNTGAVWLTWDIFDESIKQKQHPLYNLVAFFPDGGEIIFERNNGLHGFLLVNAAHQLQRAAPPNLVRDNRIPAPHTDQLVTAISCKGCHAEAKGLYLIGNDVQDLYASGTGISFDFKYKTWTKQETALFLKGLYGGNFRRRLEVGIQDYDVACRQATANPFVQGGMGVTEASYLIRDIYYDFVYGVERRNVSPERACLELGYVPFVNSPPETTLRIILGEDRPSNELKNVSIARLLGNEERKIPGKNIRRAEFNLIYSAARQKVYETMEAS